jgi:hypothetical protein
MSIRFLLPGVASAANGRMPFAGAAFDRISNNRVDGGMHSVSELLILETRAASS